MTQKNRVAAAEIEAWIISGFLDSAPGYISRGRRFLGLSDAELADAWTAAFERSSQEARSRALLDTLADYNSELILRGVPHPFHRVKEALARNQATIDSYLSNLTSKEREEFAECVRDDFEAFASRRNAAKN